MSAHDLPDSSGVVDQIPWKTIVSFDMSFLNRCHSPALEQNEAPYGQWQ